MPAKRSAEEIGRPPLSRGSACHRCFKRKVRCSPPDPDSGISACASCLRTARFKNHDLSLCKCAFNNEGLCSEEGGPQVNGEPIPATAGPTRRKLGSRTSTGSSNRSTSSRASSDSSFRSDASTSSTPSSTGTVSPASSLESIPTINKLEMELPQPPPLFQQYSSIPFQLPPPPPTMHFTSLSERPFLHNLEIQSSTSTSIASSVSSSARCSREGSPITPVDPPPPLFARRSRSGVPMQISLPTNNHRRSDSSSASVSSVAPSLDSAPLQTPASWSQVPLPSSNPYPTQELHAYTKQLPLTQVALDLAPFSALSPSSLSKFNTAAAPSFDFYIPAPQFYPSDNYGPATVGGALGLDHFPSSLDPSFATSCDYPVHLSYGSQTANIQQYPVEPAPSYRNIDHFSLDDPSTVHFAAAFGGSFHLPSPGVTFSSSTPSWIAKPQYFCT